MPSYKVIYFPLRGRAEPIRQILALAEVPFEDVRMSKEEWADYKPKTPFHQLPLLEVDGQQLGQSMAIVRYLARQFGFAGKTPFEEALVDSLADQCSDFNNECRPYFVVAGGFAPGDKDELYKTVAVPARDKFLGFVKKFLQQSGSGFLVGKSITYIDVVVSEMLSTFVSFNSSYLAEHPEISKYIADIRANPKLKKWIETRPVTQI